MVIGCGNVPFEPEVLRHTCHRELHHKNARFTLSDQHKCPSTSSFCFNSGPTNASGSSEAGYEGKGHSLKRAPVSCIASKCGHSIECVILSCVTVTGGKNQHSTILSNL